MDAIARWMTTVTAALCLAATGCHAVPHHDEVAIRRLPPVQAAMPRELDKVVIPEYVIEPPDILRIELVSAVPKAPYRLKTLDALSIRVLGTLPDAPVMGTYPVEPGGVVNLGVPYGSVKVSGMTVEEAGRAIEEHLRVHLREPEISVALASIGAAEQLYGEFLVAPDGTVTLGSYGSVSVVGKTVMQAKLDIELYLSNFIEEPQISLNVFAYNSKVFYIVLQGAGLGDVVYRLPVTGNETVLDAIAQINGLQEVSSKKIWVARPSRDCQEAQLLPVDYMAITELGRVNTNYQLLPGDRLFIAEDKLVAFDTSLAKLLTPLERLMGFTLLGAETATRLSGPVLRGGGNPRGFR